MNPDIRLLGICAFIAGSKIEYVGSKLNIGSHFECEPFNFDPTESNFTIVPSYRY